MFVCFLFVPPPCFVGTCSCRAGLACARVVFMSCSSRARARIAFSSCRCCARDFGRVLQVPYSCSCCSCSCHSCSRLLTLVSRLFSSSRCCSRSRARVKIASCRCCARALTRVKIVSCRVVLALSLVSCLCRAGVVLALSLVSCLCRPLCMRARFMRAHTEVSPPPPTLLYVGVPVSA